MRKVKNSQARTGHRRGMGGRWTDDSVHPFFLSFPPTQAQTVEKQQRQAEVSTGSQEGLF